MHQQFGLLVARWIGKFGRRVVEVDPGEAIQSYSQAIPSAAANASPPGERARLVRVDPR